MHDVIRQLSAVLILCLVALTNSPVLAADPIFDRSTKLAVAKLSAVQGATTTTFDDLNKRPVIVTFFASWCPPCREEFSHLNALAKKYQDTALQIIAINVFEAWDENDDARMKAFIRDTQPAFPALVGSEAIRDRFGGIDRIPTVYGFSRDGTLSYKFIHHRGADKTNATMAELDQAAQLLLNSL